MHKNILLISVAAAVLLAGSAYAEDRQITPYGGYCKDCALYGTCSKSIPPKEAIQSLKKFYEERGYSLGSVSHKGRFIEAVVLQNNKQVDKVIFDRKTGRIRSMY